jgi:hypothetical protein
MNVTVCEGLCDPAIKYEWTRPSFSQQERLNVYH